MRRWSHHRTNDITSSPLWSLGALISLTLMWSICKNPDAVKHMTIFTLEYVSTRWCMRHILEDHWSVLLRWKCTETRLAGTDGQLRVNVPSWELAVSKRQLINIVCCKRLCFYTTNMFPVPAWNYGNRLASEGSSCREGGIVKWKNTNTSWDKAPPVYSYNTSYSWVHYQ